MGLGAFEESSHPAAVLRWTGTAATGTDRTVDAAAFCLQHDDRHGESAGPVEI